MDVRSRIFAATLGMQDVLDSRHFYLIYLFIYLFYFLLSIYFSECITLAGLNLNPEAVFHVLNH